MTDGILQKNGQVMLEPSQPMSFSVSFVWGFYSLFRTLYLSTVLIFIEKDLELPPLPVACVSVSVRIVNL